MTSVISLGERMHPTNIHSTKTNNFALVERYHDLLNSLKDGNDCNDVLMDQEVPMSSSRDDDSYTPDTPTILCDLSTYLPSDAILHPAYDNSNSSNNKKTAVNTTPISNIPTYDSNSNIASSVSSSKPQNHFNFSVRSKQQQQQNHYPHHQQQKSQQYSSSSLTSSSSSSSSSLSSSASQSQFWSMSLSSSPAPLSSSLPSLSALSSHQRQHVSQNQFSSSLSSSSLSSSSLSSPMFINPSVSPVPSPYTTTSPSSLSSSSASSSPLLSSTPRAFTDSNNLNANKQKTFVSELNGSGCTVLSGIPNFLNAGLFCTNSNSNSSSCTDLAPSRNQEESLEYTDMDKLPEISLYDDLTTVGSNVSSGKSSTTADEGGTTFEDLVQFMRDSVESDRMELNLPPNPNYWSSSDVCRWVSWFCQRNGMSDMPELQESYNGVALCSWPSEAFVSLFGEAAGCSMFQELELWKTASNYNTPHHGVIASLQMPFMENSQMFPSPSSSPAPSNMSNHSHDSHQDFFNSSMDNSEDEVFYPKHDIKMEVNTPTKKLMTAPTKTNNGNTLKGQLCRPRIGRGHKKAITLWQFLRDLLMGEEDHTDSIRWLNKDARIFKIEDSKRVAGMWGAVKSRPAMNYDKLSRSIRQYYKKGIIKKPEQTKRLVYQFCPGVC